MDYFCAKNQKEIISAKECKNCGEGKTFEEAGYISCSNALDLDNRLLNVIVPLDLKPQPAVVAAPQGPVKERTPDKEELLLEEEFFACDLCQKTFKTERGLKLHYSKVHK